MHVIKGNLRLALNKNKNIIAFKKVCFGLFGLASRSLNQDLFLHAKSLQANIAVAIQLY